MSKKTILIMIFGLIVILASSYFSFNFFETKKTEDAAPFNIDMEILNGMSMSYDDVLDKVGGGSFDSEDLEINLDKNWIINKASPSGNNLIKNEEGQVIFNAYSLNQNNGTPWLYSIAVNNSFEISDYILGIQEGSGNIIENEEDGSFVVEFESSETSKTAIIQKIIKTNDEKTIIFSLVTVNASLEKIKDTFNYLLDNSIILNYQKTVFINSKEDNIQEEEQLPSENTEELMEGDGTI